MTPTHDTDTDTRAFMAGCPDDITEFVYRVMPAADMRPYDAYTPDGTTYVVRGVTVDPAGTVTVRAIPDPFTGPAVDITYPAGTTFGVTR